MHDSFSSVENMLRWQIDNAKRRVADMEAGFKKCGELYPLPKQTDGLPDSWAFGKLTSHEVSLAQVQHSLNFVKGQLELTETDLSKGDLPSAIYRIINVYNSIALTPVSWTSAASVRIYRYVGKYRKGKSIVAQNDRKPKPSKADLESSKDAYFAKNGKYQGWKKSAQREFDISAKTLNQIFNNREN